MMAVSAEWAFGIRRLTGWEEQENHWQLY